MIEDAKKPHFSRKRRARNGAPGMKRIGGVDIPQEAFPAVLKVGEDSN